MARSANPIDVYVETGEKKVFAVALGWPGWARSGRDEAAALGALVDYGPRYARAIEPAGLGFVAPADISALAVVERQAGDMTTNFGAPSIVLARDSEPAGPGELERWEAALAACWRAFDEAMRAAAGRELSKGPRGGGRDMAKIAEHVHDVDAAYLSSLGGKAPRGADDEQLRRAILDTLAASARGEIPAVGPKGGSRWPTRYFVRRLAWHELDHVWEIEDRVG